VGLKWTLAANAYKNPTNPALANLKSQRKIADTKYLIDQQRKNSKFLRIESQE
jgi:hypothetical protein